MGEIKPWQIVLIVAALIVLGVSIFLQVGGGSSIEKADSVLLVDVETGQLYEFSVAGRRAVIPPETHPDTGRPSLFFVDETESGDWVLTSRYVSPREIQALDFDTPALDRDTLRVRVLDTDPIWVSK